MCQHGNWINNREFHFHCFPNWTNQQRRKGRVCHFDSEIFQKCKMHTALISKFLGLRNKYFHCPKIVVRIFRLVDCKIIGYCWSLCVENLKINLLGSYTNSPHLNLIQRNQNLRESNWCHFFFFFKENVGSWLMEKQ